MTSAIRRSCGGARTSESAGRNRQLRCEWNSDARRGTLNKIGQNELCGLIDAFNRSDWQEMTVRVGDDMLYLSRDSTNAMPAGISAALSATRDHLVAESRPSYTSGDVATVSVGQESVDASGTSRLEVSGAAQEPSPGVVVESPSVGLFWVAPSPGASPFVTVGSRVDIDDTIGIVEVMKLMNHVPAGVAGVVTAVLARNGDSVEFGQPLAIIDPDTRSESR